MRNFSLHEDYQTDTTGLGEIYETLSCSLLMHRLREKFPANYVITFVSRKEVNTVLLRDISRRSDVVAAGFADIAPWRSGYRPLRHTARGSPLLRIASLVKPLLRLLASLERWYPHAVKARKAHLIWFLHSP